MQRPGRQAVPDTEEQNIGMSKGTGAKIAD